MLHKVSGCMRMCCTAELVNRCTFSCVAWCSRVPVAPSQIRSSGCRHSEVVVGCKSNIAGSSSLYKPARNAIVLSLRREILVKGGSASI